MNKLIIFNINYLNWIEKTFFGVFEFFMRALKIEKKLKICEKVLKLICSKHNKI